MKLKKTPKQGQQPFTLLIRPYCISIYSDSLLRHQRCDTTTPKIRAKNKKACHGELDTPYKILYVTAMEGMNILSIHQESWSIGASIFLMLIIATIIGLLVGLFVNYIFERLAIIGLIAGLVAVCVMTPIGITHLHDGDKTIYKVEAESQIMEYHLYKNYKVIDQDGRIITIEENGWITEKSYTRW